MKQLPKTKHSYIFQFLKILPFSLFIPVALRFITEANGPDLHNALSRGLNSISFSSQGQWFWIALWVSNLILAWFLAPIHNSWCSEANCVKLSRSTANKAIKHLDNLGVFVITLFCTMMVFLSTLHKGDSVQADFFQIPWLYIILEALATGLMMGVIVWILVENIVFPVRRLVIASFPDIRLKQTSFYRKIFVIIAAVVFFLIFQIFSTSGYFFRQGAGLINGPVNLTELGTKLPNPPPQDIHTLNGVLEVFYLRLATLLFFVLQLIFQIKITMMRPLTIIKSRLSALNSEFRQSSREIQIIHNDEFAQVYTEINQLIQRQQLELSVSKNQLNSITDSAADPIIVYDEQGIISLYNPAAAHYFDCSKEQSIGKKILDLIELENPEALFPTDKSSVPELKRLSARGIHGNTLNFEAHASRAVCMDHVEFTVVLRDISAQLELENNLTKSKLAAEKANRLKSEFLATMSHELRTPLNAVLGFTQLLSGDKNLTSSQIEKVGIINRSGEHLLALINDILDISKIEAGKMETHETVFDLVEFIRDLQDMFELRCKKKGLHLYVENVGEIPRFVISDRGKLRQILINLIGNAVKFTSEGGIGITLGREDGFFRFAITDSGRGIPESEVAAILEPFTQSSLTDHEGGTGLGLAISSRFIEMMGGQLQIESQVGKGSVFSFAIPLTETEQQPGEAIAPNVPISVKIGQKNLVLIVDDKETNRLILKEMLEGAGFITMEALNGQDAIERATEFRPQLILMDIRMPILDGYGAVKVLKANENLSETPVFALTASAFRHDEEEITQAGFDGFLAKPFKKSALLNLIAQNTKIELEYESTLPAAKAIPPTLSEPNWVQAIETLGPINFLRLQKASLINDFSEVSEVSLEISESLPSLSLLLSNCARDFDELGLRSIMKNLEATHG